MEDLTSDEEDNTKKTGTDLPGSQDNPIQELLKQVMKEIMDEDITMDIFAKVVLNASNETLTRLFQTGGVGYEHYVEMIKSFLYHRKKEENDIANCVTTLHPVPFIIEKDLSTVPFKNC